MSSILTDTKKILGIAEDYTAFDLDITMHINSAFSILTQIGVGPESGFMVECASDEWDDFITGNGYNMIQTYVYLKVKMLFDPPPTSFVIEAMNKQIQELEMRISYHREWLLSQ